MAEGSDKICKGSSSSDALLSGESTRPVRRPTVDRVYPAGFGSATKSLPSATQCNWSFHSGCFTRTRSCWQMLNNCPSYEYWHCRWWRSEHCRSWTNLPPTMMWVGRSPDLVSLPARTEHSQGGMCCPLCPNAGCLASCAVLPAIAPWEGTSSDRPMTILRTFAFIMIYTNYMVSRSGQS